MGVAATFDVEKLVPRKPSGHFWDADDIHMSVAGQIAFGERLGERLACLPCLEERVMRARGGSDHKVPQTSERKRTLTGMFASKKTVMPAGDSSCDGGFQEPPNDMQNPPKRERAAADVKAKPPVQSVAMVPARNKIGAATRTHSALPLEFDMCCKCSGFTDRRQLSSVLRRLATGLGDRFGQIPNVCGEVTDVSIGLSLSGDAFGGWSSARDVVYIRGEVLQGSAIYESLESLLGRASVVLGFDADSSDRAAIEGRGRWSVINSVIARLRLHRSC
jgi:hypothetical protein